MGRPPKNQRACPSAPRTCPSCTMDVRSSAVLGGDYRPSEPRRLIRHYREGNECEGSRRIVIGHRTGTRYATPEELERLPREVA